MGFEVHLDDLFPQHLITYCLEAMDSVGETLDIRLPQPIYNPDVRRLES